MIKIYFQTQAGAINSIVILFTILILSYSQTVAQVKDSLRNIEEEILSVEESDLEILSKSRKLLIMKLNDGNFEKAAEIKSYLDNKFAGRKIILFYPVEEFLLNYWISDLSPNLDTAALNKITGEGYQNFIEPPDDLFFSDLLYFSYNSLEFVRDEIKTSAFTAEEKDFLNIFLEYLISFDPEFNITQERLNELCNKFIEAYPYSIYSEFIRQNIRYVVQFSDYSFGFDLSVGGGNFGKRISSQFNNPINFGIGFDLKYHNILLNSRIMINGLSVKKEFEYYGIWEKDLDLTLVIPEISFGYLAVASEDIKIAPYAGISGLLFGVPENEDGYKAADVELNEFSYTTGLNFDFKVAESFVNEYSPSFQEWYVRFRLGVTNPVNPHRPIFEGPLYTLTIGISMSNRNILVER